MTRWSKLNSICPEEEFSPFFGKSETLYSRVFSAKHLRQSCQNFIFLVMSNVLIETVFLRTNFLSIFKSFFCEFFQTSVNCRVLSKKSRISRQNCTLALQIFVLGGTRFAGGSKFLKLLGVELKKTEYLCACFSIAFSKTPYTSPEDQFGREHVKKNFLVERKKDRRNAFGCLLKTTQNVYQTTTDILFRRFFGRRCGWRVS